MQIFLKCSSESIKYIIIIYIFCIILFKDWKTNGKHKNKIVNYNNDYTSNIDYLKTLKKVVYSALFGRYDNIHSIVKEYGYDYVLFTDHIIENKTDSNWTIVYIDEEIKNLNMNIIKKQRFIKTHPHLFFKNYDLSIYIDTTFSIKGKLDEFLIRILTPKLSIYVLEHPERSTINNEFITVINLHKDSNKSVTSVQNKYNRENFPDDNGLAECCLIIRKHNEFNCINFMNNWFNEIIYIKAIH